MNYTIENYKKGQLPSINDIVKIGEFSFDISHSAKGFFLNGVDCENDAFEKYLKGEDIYHFAKTVTAEYGGAEDCNSGICPYINTINGLAELIKALWDKVDKASSKKSASGLLVEDDIVNMGPFQYKIHKYHNGFFLSLENRNEMKEKFGERLGGNDAIFRLLQIDKNHFFSSILKRECAEVSDESLACPYAKTLEGLNKVISALKKNTIILLAIRKKPQNGRRQNRYHVGCMMPEIQRT